MQKFIALYMAPSDVLEDWMKADPEVRKTEEEKMRNEWQAWMAANEGKVLETAGAGKAKRVDASGATDAKNDVMMYSLVEAESAEEATALFVGHPHLGIPKAWIEVMPANLLPGMQQ